MNVPLSAAAATPRPAPLDPLDWPTDAREGSVGDAATGPLPIPPAAGVFAAEPALVLIHPSGPDLGRRVPLAAGRTVIGRGPGCHVRAPHGSVSRAAAEVGRGSGGDYWVADLGSTNGTRLNDRRVRTDPVPVRDGDYLRVGECVYRFLTGENPEAAYHDEVRRRAARDPLTGLPNRRVMADALAREVAKSRRDGRPLAVALVDVDHFKRVNDRLGHPAGDEVLKAVAGCLAGVARAGDVVARYGGEEFAAILPGADPAGGRTFGERARAAVAALQVEWDGDPVRVTISVGVAAAVGPGADAEGLLREADGRLYEAKRAGRDRVCG